MKSNIVVVFDLDDTLYAESEFELSGINFVLNELILDNNRQSVFFEINKNKLNWVQLILNQEDKYFKMKIQKEKILELYRYHVPNIQLYPNTIDMLNYFIDSKFTLALITDGRSKTQRNKISSLKIHKYFNEILISEEIGHEKPDFFAFKKIMNLYPNSQYYYIGDNVKKDFIAPNKLEWITICLKDRGFNIHKQDLHDLPKINLPQIIIDDIIELRSIITNENG